MELTISYGVVFGKGDASDRIDYGEPIELTEEESKAAMETALTGDIDEILELDELSGRRDALYAEIEEMEIEENLDMEDEYTMECQGTAPMDEDELNDLVHDRDEHALEFFGLTDADDDEIDEWDAADLDEIPTIAEFTPDFEPESPYDNGWTLNVFVDDVSISDEELIGYLKTVFASGDLEILEDIKTQCEIEFDRDIEDIILDVAKEVGCTEYIEAFDEE